MNDWEAKFFAGLMILSIFLFMPTLMYMFDKVNQHSDEKRSLLYFWFLWPCAPVFYFRVWTKHRSDCSVFPLVLAGGIVLGFLGLIIYGVIG